MAQTQEETPLTYKHWRTENHNYNSQNVIVYISEIQDLIILVSKLSDVWNVVSTLNKIPFYEGFIKQQEGDTIQWVLNEAMRRVSELLETTNEKVKNQEIGEVEGTLIQIVSKA